MKSNRIRRWAAWVAVAAILLHLGAPAVSHALIPVRGHGPHHANMTSGIERVAAHGGLAGGEPASGTYHHCPYCAPHGASLGLPPAPAVAMGALRGPDLPPAPLLPAPRPLFTWAAGQPRAPPAAA